jgi:hypothetical protein
MRKLKIQYKLGETLFCLSDISQGEVGNTSVLDGGLVLFSSPNPKTWAQTGKQECNFFFMPLWKLEELMYCDVSTPTGNLIADRFFKYGGVVRYVWGSIHDVGEHEARLDELVDFAELHKNLGVSTWQNFPDRFVNLFVEETKDGEYLLSEKPAPRVASRYIASKLSNQYVREILDATSPLFGNPQPTAHGLLFEAIALKLLGVYHTSCRLEIKQLTHFKQPKIMPKELSEDQLFVLGDRTVDIVEFNHEGDALSAITADISKLVLTLPRSSTFAGFDAMLVWPGPKGKKMPVLFLLQVTMSLQHPLSDGGLALLQEFSNSKAFSKIIIMYIVPEGVYSNFNKQSLKTKKPSTAQLKMFGVAQYCMKILVNQPSRKRKQTPKPKGKSGSDTD